MLWTRAQGRRECGWLRSSGRQTIGAEQMSTGEKGIETASGYGNRPGEVARRRPSFMVKIEFEDWRPPQINSRPTMSDCCRVTNAHLPTRSDKLQIISESPTPNNHQQLQQWPTKIPSTPPCTVSISSPHSFSSNPPHLRIATFSAVSTPNTPPPTSPP